MFNLRLSRKASSRGQAMAEFAIVAPIVALFLVIAVDFGRAYFSYVQITNGAREAAALGGSSPSGPIDLTAMRNRALLEANIQDHGQENASLQLTATCHSSAGAVIPCATAVTGGGAGNTVTVRVTRAFTLITPLASAILGNNFSMTSTATAPVLGYASSGTSNPGGTCPNPTASFAVTVLSGTTVEVDPSASTPQNPGDPCNLSGFNWSWGDGNVEPGSATAAQHTYANAGTYTITLVVTNQAGSATRTEQATVPAGTPVSCDPPVAKFTYTTAGNGANRVFTYLDQSTVTDPVDCPITAWLWTFHDGNPSFQSNAQFPTPFKYPSSGSKSVTLQVTNAGGSHSLTKSTP